MTNNNITKKNNTKWLEWFIGFNDAEGNLQVYPKKRILKSGEISHYGVGHSYHLSLHNRDASLIKDIQCKLGNVGVIYEYSNKPDCRLAVGDKKGLLYLIENVFDVYPLLSNNQFMRYSLLKNGIINEVKKFKTLEEFEDYKSKYLASISLGRQIDLIDLYKSGKLNVDNWIVGFINGEGSFYLNKNKCNFYIEHTDRQLLELIKYRLDLGPNVLERSARDRDLGKVRKVMYQLNISSKKDINQLITFLDNKDNIPLQGYKMIQYNEWKTVWNNE